MKRGYGESDDPGWGYDVATQSEDLLGLMDALGIHRAVLVGRVPATQDLTWIAEHHPERVAGLVYLGNPVVFQSSSHLEARLFGENYTRGSCDLEERGVALGNARGPWRPHFLDDETARIDVPALRKALEATDVSVPIDEGIVRAFGASMRTVVEPDLEGWPAFHDFSEPRIRRFLAEVAADFPGERGAPLRQAPQAAPSQEWVDPSSHEIRFVPA